VHFLPRFCSLAGNNLGPEAGKEIAKALTTNTTVEKIEYVRPLMKTPLLVLSCKAYDNNDFHFANLRIFSPVSAAFTTTTSVPMPKQRSRKHGVVAP
jgi:hypothetical protein